ncbi:unnamed protein product [Arabis nemorensis]|uniref:Uncharacterized protein n=1 Tax=Arabis nemorensis TaxID=586526 RepID=A0A565BUU8_9BRAS|nr:unnamed protein product [Arabis nemorensis]
MRDDLPLQYSPMSEDSDEARFYEDPTITSTSSSQPESRPTSPVSRHDNVGYKRAKSNRDNKRGIS